MELFVNTEDKTLKIKTDKATTVEELIYNIKHTLKEKISEYKIKSIKTKED
jgi:hypothetical protein